jgi:hypothetical protein
MFLYFALFFGGLQYVCGRVDLIPRKSVWAAGADGLFFGVLMSLFLPFREWWLHRRTREKPSS